MYIFQMLDVPVSYVNVQVRKRSEIDNFHTSIIYLKTYKKWYGYEQIENERKTEGQILAFIALSIGL